MARMPKRDLDIAILRGNRQHDRFDVRADVADMGGLQGILTGWLEGNGWDKKLWPEFTAEVRHAGEGKVRRTVRA
jgi:hypothetical protein